MGLYDTLFGFTQQLDELSQQAKPKTVEEIIGTPPPPVPKPVPIRKPEYFSPVVSAPVAKTTPRVSLRQVLQRTKEPISQAVSNTKTALKNITGQSPYQKLLSMFFGKQYPITQTPGPASAATRQFYSQHKGVDIATPAGTPIRLPFAGQLYYQGQQKGYGNRVGILDPATGQIYFFSHLSRIPKLTPQLGMGSIIGYTGGQPGAHGAGWTTGPHVDVEVYRQ